MAKAFENAKLDRVLDPGGVWVRPMLGHDFGAELG